MANHNPDPIRPEIRRRWESLLNGEASRREVLTWARNRLAVFDWTEEVSFQGMMLLTDLWDKTWDHPDEEAKAILFRSYWNWMELVHRYDDDPVAWNRDYARRFLTALAVTFRPESLEKTGASFVESGMISEAEFLEWFGRPH